MYKALLPRHKPENTIQIPNCVVTNSPPFPLFYAPHSYVWRLTRPLLAPSQWPLAPMRLASRGAAELGLQSQSRNRHPSDYLPLRMSKKCGSSIKRGRKIATPKKKTPQKRKKTQCGQNTLQIQNTGTAQSCCRRHRFIMTGLKTCRHNVTPSNVKECIFKRVSLDQYPHTPPPRHPNCLSPHYRYP